MKKHDPLRKRAAIACAIAGACAALGSKASADEPFSVPGPIRASVSWQSSPADKINPIGTLSLQPGYLAALPVAPSPACSGKNPAERLLLLIPDGTAASPDLKACPSKNGRSCSGPLGKAQSGKPLSVRMPELCLDILITPEGPR